MDHNSSYSVIRDVEIGNNVTIRDHVNLYGCEVGNGSKIDSFVYIEEEVCIGENCVIRPFTFIPTGVTIADNVFIAPGVTFTNDMYPSVDGDWSLLNTYVESNVCIGAGATICPDVVIGQDALVGAGAVVTKDVPPETVVAGNPAEIIRKL